MSTEAHGFVPDPTATVVLSKRLLGLLDMEKAAREHREQGMTEPRFSPGLVVGFVPRKSREQEWDQSTHQLVTDELNHEIAECLRPQLIAQVKP